MRLNEVDFGTGTPIEGYGPGFFRIGGAVIQGHALVLPGQVAEWGGYGVWDAVIAGKGDIDVLFVGTGADVAHLAPADRAVLEAEEILYETMSSPAAARTYNVLLSEGRRVGAALLTV